MRTSLVRRLCLAALAAALATGLAACGSGGGGAAPPSPAPAPASPGPSPTASPGGPAPLTGSAATAVTAPLTGLPWSGDARAVDQGALVAVLAGHPSGPAPSGLSGADLVWQEVDGSAGLRMLAVFQSRRSGSTGPLGDLRGPDVPLLKVLHPGVLYDTTFPQVLSTARAAHLVDVPPSGQTAAAYGATAGGRGVDLARAASLAPLPNVPSGFLTYATSPSDELASLGAAPVRSATVDIAGAQAQRWTYDAGSRRWQLQSPPTGSVTAANVVVQTVTYRATSRKHPDGSPVLAPRVLGRGNCSVLSRGLQAPCLWSKASDTATPVYTDQSNVPLRFEPGPTWVLLVPDNSRVQGQS